MSYWPFFLDDVKYIVPSFVVDANTWLPSSLIAPSTNFGSSQPFANRFVCQLRKRCCSTPFTGRSEAKYRVCPSGVSTGSESRYRPENGITSGSLHFPFTWCDSQITYSECGGTVLSKYSVPSAAGVPPNSSSGVETTPSPTISGTSLA